MQEIYEWGKPLGRRNMTGRKKTEAAGELAAFASWLKAARRDRGLTQTGLADLSDVDQGLISKYERRELLCPKASVRALAAALPPPEGDDRTRLHLLNAGLLAAGYAPEGALVRGAGHEITMEELDIEYAPSWHLLTPADKMVVKAVIDGLNARADAQEAAERAERSEKKAAGCC